MGHCHKETPCKIIAQVDSILAQRKDIKLGFTSGGSKYDLNFSKKNKSYRS